jgi:hypothetical protein
MEPLVFEDASRQEKVVSYQLSVVCGRTSSREWRKRQSFPRAKLNRVCVNLTDDNGFNGRSR